MYTISITNILSKIETNLIAHASAIDSRIIYELGSRSRNIIKLIGDSDYSYISYIVRIDKSLGGGRRISL